MKVTIDQFDSSVLTLTKDLIEAIERHFATLGHDLPQPKLLNHISEDLKQIVTDAHFYVAEIFPHDGNDTPSITAP